MIRLSKEQILQMQKELISATGGIFGIRDDGLLESALSAPFQSFNGLDAYPSIQQKAARLGYGLISNHAFLDGNKRIGVHSMLVFLSINGIELNYSQDELSDIILSVASGGTNVDNLTKWIITHQV